MMGFKICSLTYKFKVRVRSVKEPYGGSEGLAPVLGLGQLRYPRGVWGLAPWVRVRFR